MTNVCQGCGGRSKGIKKQRKQERENSKTPSADKRGEEERRQLTFPDQHIKENAMSHLFTHPREMEFFLNSEST